MLKLSRTGIGLLTSQYRSVLKKCLIMNMVASGFMLFAGVANASSNYNIGDIVTDPATIADDLQSMGSSFGLEAGVDIGQGILIYGDSPALTNTIVSESASGGTYGQGQRYWIKNRGITGVGYAISGTTIEPQDGTIISNKHNAGAEDVMSSGGAIQNVYNHELDSLLVVYGTTFENNSATGFYNDSVNEMSGGGAISNTSTCDNTVIISGVPLPFSNNLIESSLFDGNFAMNYTQASGGAIYNSAFATLGEGGTDQIVLNSVLVSNSNEFYNNHVGNEDFATADETVKRYIIGTSTTDPAQSEIWTWKNSDEYAATGNGGLTKEASGGAIHNAGEYTSTNDTFDANYAVGKYALGGAVFNAAQFDLYGTSGAETITPEFSYKNTFSQTLSSFTSNYVTSTEKADHSYGDVVGGKALGGAVYNGGEFALDGGNKGIKVYQNYSRAFDVALGGAVYNSGNIEIENVSFERNYVGYMLDVSDGKYYGTQEGGGALASQISAPFGDATDPSVQIVPITKISNSSFTSNYVDVISKGYGGALYNNNTYSPAETQILDTSFVSNQIRVREKNYTNIEAFGGAIYNNGNSTGISQLSIQAQNKDVNINYNGITQSEIAGSLSRYYHGGAIYNGKYGKMTIETIGNGSETLTIGNNTAIDGGAIYNMADGTTITESGSDYTSSLLINGTAGDIRISQNEADNNGGALYNNVRALATVSSTNDSMVVLSKNKAQGSGGAVYNAYGSRLSAQLGENGSVIFEENVATGEKGDGKGGAIFNTQSTFTIDNSATMESDDYAFISFVNNIAKNGGAIYNEDSNLVGNIKGNTIVAFSGNTAEEKGGAIYNDSDSLITLMLRDESKLMFNQESDDVYNLGEINITGDSNPPQTPDDATVQTSSIDDEATQVFLNSAFDGTGEYNIQNTQLNLGTTGLISDGRSINGKVYEDPTINLSNNVVNMSGNSQIYLTSDDTLINNNFDVSSNSILNYTDTSTTDDGFYLANTITNAGMVNYTAAEGDADIRIAKAVVNSGIINVADGVLTNVHIDTLKSNQGNQIVVNLDNENLRADVVTINNRIYSATSVSTNIKFVDMNNRPIWEVELEDGERIYFAQTQSDQDLSEYKFSVNADNSKYEIAIGREENGSVYDWFLYRGANKGLDPEDLAYIDLPRSAVEQTRGILFDVTRTNRGQCNCYADNCRYNECRYESSPDKYRLWAKPSYRKGTFDKPLETDFTLSGIEFGLDYQPTHSDMIGIFGSYRKGKYENDGGKVGKKYFSEDGGSEIEIKSALAGLFYRKYFGNLYFLGAGYLGKQDVDIKADNGVKATTDGINVGAQVELGYDIRSSKHSLITPSIRATYDYIKFDDLTDSEDKDVEFGTINDVELEASLKFEYQFNNEHQLPTSGYIKPSVIQTIQNGGKVKIDDKEYDKTLENETLGRIEVGADAEIIEHMSVGAFGNYTFGSDYNAWGVGGNLRIVW